MLRASSFSQGGSMPGSLYKYLADDHARLDKLLHTASANLPAVDMQPYAEFRKGLLRHISIEEKILIPVIARDLAGKHKELTARLRLDHGALVSLLVPPPSRTIIGTIRTILKSHNPLEEGEGGLYDIFERIVESGGEMLTKIQSAPEVPVLPHNEKPDTLEATRRAVARAGYKLESER